MNNVFCLITNRKFTHNRANYCKTYASFFTCSPNSVLFDLAGDSIKNDNSRLELPL